MTRILRKPYKSLQIVTIAVDFFRLLCDNLIVVFHTNQIFGGKKMKKRIWQALLSAMMAMVLLVVVITLVTDFISLGALTGSSHCSWPLP